MRQKKRLKKRLLLIVGLFTTMFFLMDKPNIVNAADTTTRGEWMSILVNQFDMTIEDGIVPDDYHGDIAGTTYYEDILIAMNFGVIDVEPGDDFEPDKPVTREFVAQTLNYCLGFQLDENPNYTMSDVEDLTYPEDAQVAVNRGWFALIDGAFSKDTLMTMEERTNMLADAAEVWTSTIIDETHTDTYEFVDGVVVVPDGTEVTINDENNTVTINNCQVVINEQDLFAVYDDGLIMGYQAVKVTQDNTNTVIETQAVDYENIIKSADVEGVVEADLSEVTSLSDDVDITYVEEEVSVASPKARVSNKAKGKIKISGKIGSARFNCEISSIKGEYKYNSGTGERYIGIKGKSKITAGVGLKPNVSIPVAEVPIGGFGKIFMYIEVKGSGEISLQYTINFTTGVSYSKWDGFRLCNTFSKESFSLHAHTDIYVGVRIGAEVKVFFAKGIVYGDIGMTGKVDVDIYNDGKTPKNCEDVWTYLTVTVGADVKSLEVWEAGTGLSMYMIIEIVRLHLDTIRKMEKQFMPVQEAFLHQQVMEENINIIPENIKAHHKERQAP